MLSLILRWLVCTRMLMHAGQVMWVGTWWDWVSSEDEVSSPPLPPFFLACLASCAWTYLFIYQPRMTLTVRILNLNESLLQFRFDCCTTIYLFAFHLPWLVTFININLTFFTVLQLLFSYLALGLGPVLISMHIPQTYPPPFRFTLACLIVTVPVSTSMSFHKRLFVVHSQAKWWWTRNVDISISD